MRRVSISKNPNVVVLLGALKDKVDKAKLGIITNGFTELQRVWVERAQHCVGFFYN